MKSLSNVLFVVSVGCVTTVAIGQNNYVATAPSSSTPGALNTIIGVGAGTNMLSTGSANTFIGYQSGFTNANGINNVFIGNQAGYLNTSGLGNLFLGQQAGYSNTTANYNTFIGNSAGQAATTGSYNIFLGSQSGYKTTVGNTNIFIGQQAGYQNQTGGNNVFVGNSSGSNTISSANTAIGEGSLLKNTTGSQNVAIGQYAGVDNNGNNNVFIGYGTNVAPNATGITNAVAIGFNAQVNQSNSIILGNNANVGIGTSAPANKVEIVQGTNGNSGLRLTNLPSGTSVGRATTDKFLTVNENGDVVLRRVDLSLLSISLGIGGRVGATPWAMEGNTISSGKSPVAIGDSAINVPAGYKLYVADGILTERVKVAVKNSSEWADYVFSSDYKLRSLDEVKQFIQSNKHLPGVPSAIDVAKNGIDVGKMHAKLLEKIEELTLYMLELKQENQSLKSTVDKLVNTTRN